MAASSKEGKFDSGLTKKKEKYVSYQVRKTYPTIQD